MKVRFFTIALAIFAGTLASCSKQDDDLNSMSGNGAANERAVAAMISGSYMVGSFSINGNDRTGDFRGIRIVFDDNNKMMAMGQGGSYSGEWGLDNANRLMKMHIEGSSAMNLLSGSYEVVSNTYSEVVLKSNDDPTGVKKVVLKKGIMHPRPRFHRG